MKIYSDKASLSLSNLNFDDLADLYDYDRLPIRFSVVETVGENCYCELDYVDFENYVGWSERRNIFSFTKVEKRNSASFNIVMIIPTGIGCEIGGHDGDGCAAARLIGSTCDKLITHPNVVNGADYNEMPQNTLYVEGSTLTKFLMGQISLREVNANRILMISDPIDERTRSGHLNMASVARVNAGMDVEVCELRTATKGKILKTPSGRATGLVERLESLFDVVERSLDNYDAFALSTYVEREVDWYFEYFNQTEEVGIEVNPVGGIEAMITHTLAERFSRPFAHSPHQYIDKDPERYNFYLYNPRKAAVGVSGLTHVFCLYKGLYKSPQIVQGLDGDLCAGDVSCLVQPDGCIGLPTLAALEQGIPVVAVDNKNIMKNRLENLPFKKGQLIKAKNYLEAAGLLQCLKSGITAESVLRPIEHTKFFIV